MSNLSSIRSLVLCSLALLAAFLPLSQGDQCLANDEFETFFLGEGETLGALPREGSCCQKDICGLPCPTTVPSPTSGRFLGIVSTVDTYVHVVGLEL
jgi:hypothetical protein